MRNGKPPGLVVISICPYLTLRRLCAQAAAALSDDDDKRQSRKSRESRPGKATSESRHQRTESLHNRKLCRRLDPARRLAHRFVAAEGQPQFRIQARARLP